jgi:hypothetical protein
MTAAAPAVAQETSWEEFFDFASDDEVEILWARQHP